MLAQNSQSLLSEVELVASQTCYILPLHKSHTSCPEMTSAASVSESTALFCSFLPHWVEPLPICLKRKKILVNDSGVKKSVGFCSVWLLCFHFLFACRTVKHTNSGVHAYFFCCRWGFLTCPQLFLHIIVAIKWAVRELVGIPHPCFKLLTRSFSKWHIWQILHKLM